MMKNNRKMLLCDYYESWIKIYKEGSIRPVTLEKYYQTLNWIRKIAPRIKLRDITRTSYQEILNAYAEEHERETVMDFHHQLKGAILDALDENLIPSDPTRKIVIKGKPAKAKKGKFLSQFELHALLSKLHLGSEINDDWLIYLIAKTGLRYAEALGLTPKDFDFGHQTISVSKTWDYKSGIGSFQPTKNRSSVRKIPADWQTMSQFAVLIRGLSENQPIFVHGRVFNSTTNHILLRRCKEASVPSITIHGLRHTHASLLLFAGVSIASVSRRLGHSSMNTTEKVYLHVIKELESSDTDLVMRSLSSLN
jgi:integrase